MLLNLKWKEFNYCAKVLMMGEEMVQKRGMGSSTQCEKVQK